MLGKGDRVDLGRLFFSVRCNMESSIKDILDVPNIPGLFYYVGFYPKEFEVRGSRFEGDMMPWIRVGAYCFQHCTKPKQIGYEGSMLKVKKNNGRGSWSSLVLCNHLRESKLQERLNLGYFVASE